MNDTYVFGIALVSLVEETAFDQPLRAFWEHYTYYTFILLNVRLNSI